MEEEECSTAPVHPAVVGLDHRRFVRPARAGRVYATELPTTRLLAAPCRVVDWSDAYAVRHPARRTAP